jgi:hypothetical protein
MESRDRDEREDVLDYLLFGEVQHVRLLHRIESLLRDTNRRMKAMAVDQAGFDAHLTALVDAITTLIAAVDALVASKPTVDLTAEDNSVLAASQAVADELGKLGPAPVPAPADVPPEPPPGQTAPV